MAKQKPKKSTKNKNKRGLRAHNHRTLSGRRRSLERRRVTAASVDPFPNPVLAPTIGTETNGARFGCSRDGGSKWHGGTDLKASVGTEFCSIYPGEVQLIRANDTGTTGVGNFVIVKSPNLGISIKYCHLSKVSVNVGDSVTAGMILGKTGKSGNAYNVPFPHLHIEVSTDFFATPSKYVDPEPYLKTKYTPANPNEPDKTKC